MNKQKFWKFWSIVVLIAFALITGQIYFGLFEFLLQYDQTFISFIIMGILAISQIMIAKLHLTKSYQPENHKMVSFMSDASVTLGLTGTLIGFMIVLWSVFGPGVILDPENTASMLDIIAKMAQGMSAALVTSLTGIITSALIKLQLVILEE